MWGHFQGDQSVCHIRKMTSSSKISKFGCKINPAWYYSKHFLAGCSIPCHYGTCVTSVNGTADYCKCTTGYQGDTCQWGECTRLYI